MTIKAIETEYNGYRFRSRLEARWAIFFDAAGIEYQYEPEGFEFEDGTKYLPDFYLPWFKCYVEIKPFSLNGEEENEAKRKLEMLFCNHGDCCVMLCKGDPFDDSMFVGCLDVNDSSGGWCCDDWWKARFIMGGWFGYNDGAEYSGGKRFISLCLGWDKDRVRSFYTGEWNELPSVEQYCALKDYRSDLDYAKKEARKARFEHGETPVIAHA